MFTDPQFVDANGTGGLTAAFGLVSGSITSQTLSNWAAPGLLAPESMTLAFAGMLGNVNLPSPWGVVNASGIVVRAHGSQTGQDTTSYAVDFTGLVPATGSMTGYLVATIQQIQQNPFPLTGPPQGHPSYNPNFVPSTAYATNTYTVALNAASGGVDNVSVFELARTTLTPGQVAISSFSVQGWQRAAPRKQLPLTSVVSGGLLPLSGATALLMPSVSGLTSTLPLAVSGGGLLYTLANPLAAANWTVAASTGNLLSGATVTPGTSLTVPPYGAAWFWGNATAGSWEMIAANPLMVASLANTFTAPQTISVSGAAVTSLTLVNTGTTGVGVEMTGNGAVTPNKYLRVVNGQFQIVNSGYTTAILALDDAGDLTVSGQSSAGSLSITGAAAVGNGLTVTNGLTVFDWDSGGLNARITYATNSPAVGFRSDGTYFYLLLTGTAAGAYNGYRPLYVNLNTAAVSIDGTGAGVTFGGMVTIPDVVASVGTVGAVSFPGGGVITTAGAITTSSSVSGVTVASTNGPVTAGNGRLRAALGAYGSGDPNAATILNDFLFTTSGGTYFRQIFPNGFVIQGYVGSSVTGSADAVSFPVAFATACIDVIVEEANPVTFWPTGNVTLYAAQSISATGFTLYSVAFITGAWAPRGGLGYRYVAFGY